MAGKNQILVLAFFLALWGCEKNEVANRELSKKESEVDLTSLKAPNLQNEPVPYEVQKGPSDSAESHGLDSAEESLASDSNLAPKEVLPSERSEVKEQSSANMPEVKEKPAFLARECSSQNEGEMGFNAKEKRAYFCNGSQWVKLSKKLLKDQNISGVNLETIHDQSFLCQKSEAGGFRCMKAATYKMAH
jgi:hypothetical protein